MFSVVNTGFMSLVHDEISQFAKLTPWKWFGEDFCQLIFSRDVFYIDDIFDNVRSEVVKSQR